MSKVVDLESLFHRNKARIKELGEVFTPMRYVEEMLDLLATNTQELWSDEQISFFEPCSGHGNIVLSIYNRRLEGIFQKAVIRGLNKTSEAPYYAVANAINTLWAIDIDYNNVENCRSRLLQTTLQFLKAKSGIQSDLTLLSQKRNFFIHVLSAIKWHINENETLSALSATENAKSNANLTKAGTEWFRKNGHHPIDFGKTWVNFYQSCQAQNTVPFEYKRSVRFLDNLLSGIHQDAEDFEFALTVIECNNAHRAAIQPAEKQISLAIEV